MNIRMSIANVSSGHSTPEEYQPTTPSPSEPPSASPQANRAHQDTTQQAVLNIGSRTCQCAQCNHYFGGVTGFDKHLIGADTSNPRCRTPKQMQSIGMVANINGVWTTGRAYQGK